MTNPTVGSSVPLSLAPGGAAATLTVTLPGGSILDPELVVTATPEEFTATLDTTQPGRHLLSWYVPAEDQFFTDVVDVWPSDPRYLVSIADALAQVSGSNVPTETKAAMPLYVATATYVIERLAGPVLLATRTKVYDGRRNLLLPATNAVVTSITMDGSVLDPSSYTVDDEAGIIYGSFGSERQSVTVAYQVGGSTVPANIQLAALELVRHLWQSSRQSGRPGAMNAAADTVSTPFGFAVPKRVVELCESTTSAPGFA